MLTLFASARCADLTDPGFLFEIREPSLIIVSTITTLTSNSVKSTAPEIFSPLWCRFVLGSIVIVAIGVYVAAAQSLRFQQFTAADGLVQDNVNRIVRDSRGFLWFCTGDGLSRYDGFRFKNYAQEQGLPHRNITDLIETRAGEYLIASSGGISILDRHGEVVRWDVLAGQLEATESRPLFRTFVPPKDPVVRASSGVNAIAEHSDGNVYAGTNHGLFRFTGTGDERNFEKINIAKANGRNLVINALLEDSHGGLWIGADLGVYRLDRDGAVGTIAETGTNSIFEDRDGRVWIDSGGHDFGIRVYEIASGNPRLASTFSKKDGLRQNPFSNAIGQSSSGTIYVRSGGALSEYRPDGKSTKFVELGEDQIGTAGLDAGGNIWFGTFGKGVLRLAASNISTFDRHDRNTASSVDSIFFDRSGRIGVVRTESAIEQLVDGTLRAFEPLELSRRMWGDTFLDFQSRTGEWWIPTSNGLYRYPAVAEVAELAHTPPKKVYRVADGLGSNAVFSIFEDSSQDIWITIDNATSLYRWERATDKIVAVTNTAGITSDNGGANAFGEDRSGNVWLGFFFGGLLRFKDGEFRRFDTNDGIPEGTISDFHSDREGRLWIATRSRGIFRVDDPNADAPKFTNISTRDGLHSNQVACLAEDSTGTIYAGTGRGLHRIDPKTGSVKVYTQRDGLPGNYVYRCQEDPAGDIWFVASDELARLQPMQEVAASIPVTYIERFAVNGTEKPISELGDTNLEGIELDAGQNRIDIGYFALGIGSGEIPRYQYRLGNGEWSSPTTTPSVTFDLAPGNYNFEVRSVTTDGTVGENPSRVSFSIAYPIWQRWWFLLLAFLFVGGAVFALDRYRVSKTRQVQRALARSRESESRFRTLAETASDAIITIEEDSTIVFVNDAVERVFGYAPDEVIGKKLTMLMPESMRDGHNSGLGRYVRSSTRHIEWSGVTLPGLKKDGTEIPLELSFGEFERGGKRYFTGIARDITERLKAEEEIRTAREERMRELQRVRSRIATDLHDDIGSSLTQIAVLSEVARGQASQISSDGLSAPLERIKNVSKELVAVMSDIVWAINPQKDYLNDLVQRMRRFGSDVLSSRGVHFEFHAPEMHESIELGANIRREVFAIFKESVNNAVKYSECTNLVADFSVSEDTLVLKVADNGKGFDTAFVLSDQFKPEMGGNGLVSIRRRAMELGGYCMIRSEVGVGSEIELTVPIGPHHSGGV